MGVRHLTLELTALGPVHVGDGSELGNKDYFLPNGKDNDGIAVLDAKGFVSELDEAQLDVYSRFLEEADSRKGLQELFFDYPVLKEIAQRHTAYTIQAKLEKNRSGKPQYLGAAAMVKDAYGNPYVPGSSIKGIIRTVLLCAVISESRDNYAKKYDRGLACDRYKRKTAGQRIERGALWVEETDGNPKNIRDIMHYVSVSDSEPLDVSDLTFVKKYDKFSMTDDGSHKQDLGALADAEYWQGNALNIYRECIKPGTKMAFCVDIDERIDDYLGMKLDAKGLAQVFKRAHVLYGDAFLDHFDLDEGGATSSGAPGDGQCSYIAQAGPLAGTRCRNQAVGDTGYCNLHAGHVHDEKPKASTDDSAYCYVGGGTDYLAKTIIKALFDTQGKRVDEASHILYSQFPTKIAPGFYTFLKSRVQRAGFTPQTMKERRNRNGKLIKAKDDHRHWQENEMGVSPHTIKLGIVDGRKLQMGKCEVKVTER